jgi:putative NADH-flavin reductase
MRLLILGATGGTGRAIVRLASTRQHEVTILARNAEKARGFGDARIVVGDALDPAAVARALDGAEAVISALGTPVSPFREVTLLSAATRILIAEMQRLGVGRLIAITGMGAGETAGHGGFLFDRLFKPLMLRKVYADKDRQEAIIRSSGLDWTIVRPAVLNDKPARGSVRALTDLTDFQGGSISREDVAAFILDELASGRWRNKAPLIAW